MKPSSISSVYRRCPTLRWWSCCFFPRILRICLFIIQKSEMFSSCFLHVFTFQTSRLKQDMFGDRWWGWERWRVKGLRKSGLATFVLLICSFPNTWGLVCRGQFFWLLLKSRGKLTSQSPSSRSLTEDRITASKNNQGTFILDNTSVGWYQFCFRTGDSMCLFLRNARYMRLKVPPAPAISFFWVTISR